MMKWAVFIVMAGLLISCGRPSFPNLSPGIDKVLGNG